MPHDKTLRIVLHATMSKIQHVPVQVAMSTATEYPAQIRQFIPNRFRVSVVMDHGTMTDHTSATSVTPTQISGESASVGIAMSDRPAKRSHKLCCLLIMSISLAASLSCSREKSVPTLPDAHPREWMISDSPDFHGKVTLSAGLASCAECHGQDFDGGTSEISCIECHQQLDGFCVSCHGGLFDMSGAPPYSLDGDSLISDIGVGAHQSHLAEGEVSAGFSCNTCHNVPAFAQQEGHYDSVAASGLLITDSIADLHWGQIAGGSPTWTRETATCSSTYCHGNFSGGDQTNTPVWTASNQAQCGSCHDIGSNPATLGWKHAFHVINVGLECGDCHGATVDNSLGFVDLSLHVNGIADTLTLDENLCNACHGPSPTCTACHGGTDNASGAPPIGLEGETSNLSLAVGAHTTHMEGGDFADAFACVECHTVPATISDPGHLDSYSIAEVVWGPLAGGAAVWNRAAEECSNVYCHGNFSGGYTSNSPQWTSGASVTCGSCHDDGSYPRNLSGEHDKHVRDKGVECYQCHNTVVNASETIIGRSLHVDGSLQVSFSSGSGTYSNGSCSDTGCHGTESWIDD